MNGAEIKLSLGPVVHYYFNSGIYLNQIMLYVELSWECDNPNIWLFCPSSLSALRSEPWTPNFLPLLYNFIVYCKYHLVQLSLPITPQLFIPMTHFCWVGPGPAIESIWSTMWLWDLNFVALDDGASILNCLASRGGDKTKVDIVLGLDNNLMVNETNRLC